MRPWHAYAAAAAILYALHQVFTRLAARDAGAILGGLIVELSAAAVILVYLLAVMVAGSFAETVNVRGAAYAIATGICVGLGTVFFFELFRHGGPLSAVPAVIAAGSALMAIIAMSVLGEPADAMRMAGVGLSVAAILCLTRG